jgi:multidrug efflux pump subunit AcrA (membrane-fusion protein)
LREKVGQYFREGDLICVIEESTSLQVEISLAEQDMTRVQVGQEVALKVRVLPCATFPAQVRRIAPSAVRTEGQSNVTVHCTLPAPAAELRPDMTGYARIYTGRRTIGAIVLDRFLRLVRTEFWW